MNGKYFRTEEIKPQMNRLANVAYSAGDVLFNWTAFTIPKGSCIIRSCVIKMQGTNAGAGNGDLDFTLYFAKRGNPHAADANPESLGIENSAPTVAATTAARPNIIASMVIDGSSLEDSQDGLISYNVLGDGSKRNNPVLMIGSGVADLGPADGSAQTLFIAGVASGAYDFGTGVDVAGAHSADDLTIVTDGTDAHTVFAIGDVVQANDADGSDPTAIGTVTAVLANLITVDAAPNDIDDDHEITNRSPITLVMGLEY